MKRVDVISDIREIETQKVVTDWLDGLSPNSRRTYLAALGEFIHVIKRSPEELLDIAFGEIEDRTPPWKLSINQWFDQYEAHCLENKRSKATRNIRTSVIKSFFHFYKIDTPSTNTRRKKESEFKVKNDRPGLTKEDIKQALAAAKTNRLKAVILTQASSGLSISDVVNLQIKDFENGLIDVDGKQVCQLKLRRQKTDKKFITYISFEGVEAIKTYLKTERRFEYGSEDYLFSNFYRNKKVTPDLMQKDYRVLNERLNNKESEYGAYRAITSHMLRKFFNTQLSNSNMNYEIRKYLMGHVLPNKVDNSYYLVNPDELLREYLKHLESITINPLKVITLETDDHKELKKMKKKLQKNEEVLEEIKKALFVSNPMDQDKAREIIRNVNKKD